MSIDRILSGVTTPGQSGPGGNDNEGVFHIPERTTSGASSSDGFVSYLGNSLRGILLLCKDAVYGIHIFSSLKISNKNLLKNILEI